MITITWRYVRTYAVRGHMDVTCSKMSAGRPTRSVDREKVEFLRSIHFTWIDISGLVGVSPKTLQRRAREWNIPRKFTLITDSELDSVIKQYLQDFPRSGEALIIGHLKSINIIVQRARLRLSVRRVTGTTSSPHPGIYRRAYQVPGSNYLWHVDGNHKMIKWRLVIHGGIDGFSRLITYLRCSNNNMADTVTQCFIGATHQYGVPSRVRSDHGTENVGIWSFMEEVRGRDRNSYIAGKSVHNTRIERLWRDVYTSVSCTYVQTFEEMEQRSILDWSNDCDLFCLHYVFLPKINASLKAFQSCWNNHPLSTEGNRTPIQLYAGGSLGSSLFDEDIDLQTYGVDIDLLIPEGEEDACITVPETRIDLSEDSVQILRATVNPQQPCNDFGVELYKNAVQTVYQLLQDENHV